MGLKDRMKDVATKAGTTAIEKAGEVRERRAEQRQAEPSPPAGAAGGIVFEGTSHDEGRNARVTLYTDRLERVKERSRTSLSRAAQDTEVTPVSSISSVQATKAGFKTNVIVFASGNNIEFRFEHDEAQRFKDALTKLVLDRGKGGGAAMSSVADELAKLAGLRDSGVLNDAEFEAQKARLLG